jgi:hypothetical protein
VGNFEEFVREADLIEDFQDRRMDRVSTKIAVEILVHLEEGYGNPTAREEKSKHGAGRPSTDDATRSCLHVVGLVLRE